MMLPLNWKERVAGRRSCNLESDSSPRSGPTPRSYDTLNSPLISAIFNVWSSSRQQRRECHAAWCNPLENVRRTVTRHSHVAINHDASPSKYPWRSNNERNRVNLHLETSVSTLEFTCYSGVPFSGYKTVKNATAKVSDGSAGKYEWDRRRATFCLRAAVNERSVYVSETTARQNTTGSSFGCRAGAR